jgi:hypothetical protein
MIITQRASGQLLVSDSSAALVTSLDNNVAAIDRMTVSNERVVERLESSVEKMVESNNRNVEQLVNSTDKLMAEWHTSIEPSIQKALDAWENSLKPTVNEALHKWDHSIGPQIQQIADMGQGALKRWDESIEPRVDDALQAYDRTLKTVNTTIIGRLDEYSHYTRAVFIPLIFTFVTLWVGICCCAMPILCLLVGKNRNTIKSAHGNIDPKTKAGMASSFRGVQGLKGGVDFLSQFVV